MNQFIAYHIGGGPNVPIATGHTHDEAMRAAITRTLCAGISNGEIAVQERADVSADDFEMLTQALERTCPITCPAWLPVPAS